MNEQTIQSEDVEAHGKTSGDAQTGCCGSPAEETTAECPCGGFMKQRRFAAVGIISVMALMFLVSQVGGVLGIIAFVRTF